jgi:hypothetical protein
MKNKLLSVIAILLVFTLGLKAQTTEIPGYVKFADKFGDEDKLTMEKVNAEVADAVNRMNNVLKEEKDLQKYFQKKNTSKGEKKSVPQKQKWIGAYNIYINGLNSVYDMYNSWLNNATYYDDQVRAQVADLASKAEVNRGKANDLFGNYRKSSESDLKKNVKYTKMKVDLNQAGKMSMDALNYMVEALEIVFRHEEMMSKDELAWKKALAQDDFDAYVAYIKDFPRGKHVEEAKIKIKEYKERIAAERSLKEQENVELIYKVQILAVSKQANDRKKKKLYSNTSQIEEFKDPSDGLYKYYVGKFSKYTEAKAFEKKLGIGDAFVVGYKNGVRIDILQAQDLEKKVAQ